MPQIKLTTGIQVEAGDGISILEAAALAGVQLGYSCRTGRCSTCRCRVIEGETRALSSETGLDSKERAAGWILGCVRTAITDVVLQADMLEGLVLPQARLLPCRIDSIERMAPDVLSIRLRLPPGAAFEYLAGQYIEVIGPGGVRRSYSLACAPRMDAPLELHVRAVEGGAMSDHWFARARAGDLLRLRGPLGTFALRDVAGSDLILLATGTGIAPVKAIIESLPMLGPERAPRSVTVLWGGRAPSDLYLDIAALPGGHRYIPVLSRAGDGWDGARGHVQDVLLAHQPSLGGATVYACGSDAMIHGARVALTGAGLLPGRFYSDAFVCSAAQPSTGGR